MMRALARAFPQLNRDLTADEIASQCEKWIPVNTTVNAAIEAHRMVFGRYYRDGNVADPTARAASMYALRVVTFARTPSADDYRQMIDYLTGLPMEAWTSWDDTPAETVRSEHLTVLSRSLTWVLEQ
jgi:hypothetical protein